jgi:hypothetical protein
MVSLLRYAKRGGDEARGKKKYEARDERPGRRQGEARGLSSKRVLPSSNETRNKADDR